MTRKLLLADDSITIQKVVELVLTDEGFEIKAVTNGEEALAAIKNFRPDIVLADIDMPKINGYQLCEKIKSDTETKDIPVILLSGAFEPIDEALSKQVRADSYIVKPFESQELISKINSILRSLAKNTPTIPAEEVVFAQEADDDSSVVTAEVFEEAPQKNKLKITSAEETTSEYSGDVIEIQDVSIDEAMNAAKQAESLLEQTTEMSAVETSRFSESVVPSYEKKSILKQEIPVQKKSADIPMPSQSDMSNIIKKTVDEKVQSLLSSLDLKDTVMTAISPTIKESLEKILWEISTELTERMLKETIQNSMASINKEVEKVIWETVPEVAETLISKEIKKIRSET
ncbi:MAG: response regulator [Nitrospiraceae bacterium]|nr:response regulator [Nitrospiraceae bacterium]